MIIEEESILDVLAEFDDEDFDWRDYGLRMVGDGCFQKENVKPKY